MSLTRRQLRELHRERVQELRLRGEAGGGSGGGRVQWLVERGAIGKGWPWITCAAWIAVYTAALVLEPAASDPDAAEPLWAALAFLGVTVALAGMCAGLLQRQRAGLLASVVAAGIMLGAAVACPASGHHASPGAWWYGQMAGFASLAALGLHGLRRSRPRRAAVRR